MNLCIKIGNGFDVCLLVILSMTNVSFSLIVFIEVKNVNLLKTNEIKPYKIKTQYKLRRSN